MMEEEQPTQEPSQHFENIDFNTTPDANDRESSNHEDQDEVNLNFIMEQFSFKMSFGMIFGCETKKFVHLNASAVFWRRQFFSELTAILPIQIQNNGAYHRIRLLAIVYNTDILYTPRKYQHAKAIVISGFPRLLITFQAKFTVDCI